MVSWQTALSRYRKTRFVTSSEMLPDLVERGLIVRLTEAVRLDFPFQWLDFPEPGANAIASASGAYEVQFRVSSRCFLFWGTSNSRPPIAIQPLPLPLQPVVILSSSADHGWRGLPSRRAGRVL